MSTHNINKIFLEIRRQMPTAWERLSGLTVIKLAVELGYLAPKVDVNGNETGEYTITKRGYDFLKD